MMNLGIPRHRVRAMLINATIALSLIFLNSLALCAQEGELSDVCHIPVGIQAPFSTIQISGIVNDGSGPLHSGTISIDGGFVWKEITEGAFRIDYPCGPQFEYFQKTPFSPVSLADLNGARLHSAVYLENSQPPLPGLNQALAYEDFIAQVEKRRLPARDPKPFWQVFLESVGGAALITVTIGGLAGAGLGYFLQLLAKKRDHNISQLETEKERQVQRALAFLDDEMKTVMKLLEHVTSACSKAENLAQTAERSFQVDASTPDSTKKQIEDTKVSYNSAVDEWRTGRELFGFNLGVYHGRDSEVFLSWTALRTATTNLLIRAYKIAMQSNAAPNSLQSDADVAGGYREEKEKVEKALVQFQEAIFKNRSDLVEIQGLGFRHRKTSTMEPA